VTIAGSIRRALATRGVVVTRRRSLRFGVDELVDIERLLPRVDVVLDIGANDGSTALSFASAFADARVYAFEPIPSTFATLAREVAGHSRIACFNVALGAGESELTIRLKAKSGHNSLLDVAEPGPGAVTVTVTTGDSWASAQGIEHVDVLKIDTEGYELEVLRGFERLLQAGRVACVLAECELERVTKEPHASFFDLYEHLTERGLGLVSLYTDAIWSNRFARGNALFMRRVS
jgi:FkbM family methyltransferase